MGRACSFGEGRGGLGEGLFKVRKAKRINCSFGEVSIFTSCACRCNLASVCGTGASSGHGSGEVSGVVSLNITCGFWGCEL